MTEVNWYIKAFYFLAGGVVFSVGWILVGLVTLAMSPSPL